jgi:hypothetical protein
MIPGNTRFHRVNCSNRCDRELPRRLLCCRRLPYCFPTAVALVFYTANFISIPIPSGNAAAIAFVRTKTRGPALTVGERDVSRRQACRGPRRWRLGLERAGPACCAVALSGAACVPIGRSDLGPHLWACLVSGVRFTAGGGTRSPRPQPGPNGRPGRAQLTRARRTVGAQFPPTRSQTSSCEFQDRSLAQPRL